MREPDEREEVGGKFRSRADGVTTVVGPKFTRTDGVEVSVSRRVQGSQPNSRELFFGQEAMLTILI